MKNKLIAILTFTFYTFAVFAQAKKAGRLYEEGQYINAAKLYAKVVKRHPDNGMATYKLANAYRILDKYDQAEKYYAKAATLKGVPDTVHLYYGQLLKITGKTDDASTQFNAFVNKHPDSFLGKLLLASCKSVAVWKAAGPSCKISPVDGINSGNSDFSPLIIGKDLVFTSDRNGDLVNDMRSTTTDQPFFSMYFTTMNAEGKPTAEIKHFSNRINTTYHDGPAAFNEKTGDLFFDKATISKHSKKNTIKLFIAEKKGGKWTKPQPFQWNSEKYSIMHPAISDDGKTLYFASDMPGGQGGFDIWKSVYENNTWSKPVNMGAEINTAFNEVFPVVYKNTLYFSSDGQKGYGGLDVFRYDPSAKAGKRVINMKAPFNSPYDDFGVCFKSDSAGYLSSNRPGGMGKDDIYAFKLLPQKKKTPKTRISGVFEYKNLPSDGIKVNLMTADDKLIKSTTTDSKGQFNFSELSPDKNYLVVIDESDGKIPDDTKMYFTNSKGQKVILANKLTRKMFSFKALTADEYNNLPILKESDDQLLTVPLSGQVYQKLPGDYGNKIKVYVVDDKGNIIAQTTTDENGKFNFAKLPPDQKYLIKLQSSDGSLKVIILNDKGKLLAATKSKGESTFQYTRLKSDKNLIHLLNEKDQVITISANENFTISDIYYDYNKYNVNSEAAKQLDKLAVIMKKNPQIHVLLKSYTDSRGGDEYNMKLSQKRASTAVKYVVNKGIDPKRVTGKGFGETDPVNNCGNGVPCTEAQYAKNRRTEVEIIATNHK